MIFKFHIISNFKFHYIVFLFSILFQGWNIPFTSSLLPFDFLLKVGIFYLENNVKIESPSLCFFQVPWRRLIDHYVISGAEPRGSCALAISTDTLDWLGGNLSFIFIVGQVISFSLGLIFLTIKMKETHTFQWPFQLWLLATAWFSK